MNKNQLNFYYSIFQNKNVTVRGEMLRSLKFASVICKNDFKLHVDVIRLLLNPAALRPVPNR